jgi:hypothetical protein
MTELKGAEMIRLVCLPIALMLCWGLMGWMLGGCSDNGGTEQDGGVDAQDAGFDAGADQGADEQEVDAGHDAGADEGADLEFDAGVDVEVDPCEGIECEDPCAVYVDLNVAAPGDGLTPGTALTDVQAGIDAAAALAGDCCTCQVHVAQGTYWAYKETAYDGFALSERVDLLGGYPTGFGEEADPALYETILDGHKDPEGGVPDDAFRAYHVVIAADLLTIDGFTITGGNAQYDDSEYNPDNYGGGMISLMVSPTVTRCHFTGNQAMHGAGMYNSESTSLIETCLFDLNTASRAGGGMLNRAGGPRVVDGQFLNNTADMGAGVFNGGATVATFTTSPEGTCSFEGNSATTTGGGMDNQDCAPVTTG